MADRVGDEIYSMPVTPRSYPITPRSAATVVPTNNTTPPISAPPSQFPSPSLMTSLTPRSVTPLASPMRIIINMTKLDPQDAWLPITESRSGNAYYAAFHTLCSGIGIQALVLPVAFTILGWTWGIISLSLGFIWQLYTLWLLVHLHESADGTRYNRYLQLFTATFGKKAANWLATFPIMYLSGGTCVTLIIIGGSTMKLFFQIVWPDAKPLTTVEWYLVFTCIATVLSQLPNLNSIAGVSLVGAITAVGYCTLLWVVSVTEGKIPKVSYNPIVPSSDIAKVFSSLNALGIIAFAFRGHNLVLEIQATMPSSEKYPSRVPMWRGVKFAYLLVAICLFPLAIGGYWAYGQMIPGTGGMLSALYAFHSRDTSKFILGLTSLFVVVNALSSFQINGMPIFDLQEQGYTNKHKKACPKWLRSAFRFFFGFLNFFIAVAFPFLGSIAALLGGLALPITLSYPCFMWIAIKKPKKYRAMWLVNWGLGILGAILTVLLIAAGLWSVVKTGIKLNFFKP